jgi:hypothetical protein
VPGCTTKIARRRSWIDPVAAAKEKPLKVDE